jgi:hypothetical protein
VAADHESFICHQLHVQFRSLNTQQNVNSTRALVLAEYVYNLAPLGIFLMACLMPKSPYPRSQTNHSGLGFRNLLGRPRFLRG